MPSSAADRFTPIDMHVHLVGNGLGGSGCWLRLGFWHKPLAAWMVKHIGMRVQPTDPAWDEEYVAHLARLVRESSMSAAVLLAQDEVYHADGRKMEGCGVVLRAERIRLQSRARASGISARVLDPSRTTGCTRGVGTLSGSGRGVDEVPAELPQHRLQRCPLPALLGAHGGGGFAAARAHRRGAHRAGHRAKIRRSARAAAAARVRRECHRRALRDEERTVRPPNTFTCW
jgi:hypothetical protein